MLAPVICVSHGGGPLPLLNDPSQKSITASLKTRVPHLLNLHSQTPPRAILLITAHWSTPHPAISSAEAHPLLYDYYGFPKQTYHLAYPAPGSPEIANHVARAMQAQGLDPVLDPVRGWDHGVFVPLLLVLPEATVPIVQLSVLGSEDPDSHFRMGKALHALRGENIAILGSGFASFHNLGKMRELMMKPPVPGSAFKTRSDEWNEALTEAVSKTGREERLEALKGWRGFPHAYEMHPRGGGEHFMPLLVCAAAGGDEPAGKYKDDFMGVNIFTYYWGSELPDGE